ncbi:protein of unknown function [Candidatus Hydrogenisulfobacillus filiaventi]|uniref:Uncharacterized protein n=1 Tax=Candidatus Hydrogenisulfobacillus filiaventi TaxID=2707344 RepID=A0A6F8ZK82_9FIRM|nr:protein of unknown function [Candidatus Hydrogenisulfobacillus filiaventi]
MRQQLAALPVPEGVEAALRAPRAGPARSRVQVRRFWAGWMLGAFLGDSALQLAGVQDPAAGAGDGPRWGWHPEGGAVAIGPMPGYFPVAFPVGYALKWLGRQEKDLRFWLALVVPPEQWPRAKPAGQPEAGPGVRRAVRWLGWALGRRTPLEGVIT